MRLAAALDSADLTTGDGTCLNPRRGAPQPDEPGQVRSGGYLPDYVYRFAFRATHRVLAAKGERLSGLSSGLGEFLAGVAGFGVEPDQQLVGERDADDLFGLAGLAQAGVEGGEVGLEAADHFGDPEQDAPHTGAPAAHGTLAAELAAVSGDRGEAGELGGGLAGQGPDLRHLGHEAGDGPVGDALDRAEGLVERAPERVGVDQGGDLGLKTADLPGRQGRHLVDGGENVRLGHEPTLVGLGGA